MLDSRWEVELGSLRLELGAWAAMDWEADGSLHVRIRPWLAPRAWREAAAGAVGQPVTLHWQGRRAGGVITELQLQATVVTPWRLVSPATPQPVLDSTPDA